MASKTVRYSNCNLENIQVRCSRELVIPDFGTWIESNQGNWLDGPVFSPIQGVQLQIKILGSSNSNGLVYLKNCLELPVQFADCSLTLEGWVQDIQINTGCVRSSAPQMGSFVLGLSEKFELNWSSKDSWHNKRVVYLHKESAFAKLLEGKL